MKKVIAIVISTIIVLSLGIPALAADTCQCGNCPIVYVIGQCTIYKDPSASPLEETISFNEEKIKQVFIDGAPYLLGALAFGTWDLYCDELYRKVVPFFENYSLGKEGTVENKSGILWSWTPEAIPADQHKEPGLNGAYYYYYDARLDPFIIADDLNNYIEAIKAATGHSKVSIVSRCLGTNIALAYLEAYQAKSNYSGIDTFIMYSGSMNGVAVCGELYSGKLSVHSESINRFATDKLGDDALNTFLKSLIALSAQTYTLNLGSDTINYIYEKVYENVLPRIMKSTFGHNPGYWSMVADKDYEDAKALIFKDDADEYSVLIEKIDHYHYTIANNAYTIVKKIKDSGVKIGVLCKYGYQLPPVVESCELLSDNTIEVSAQSFGATCSKVNETLSKKYLADADGKYISPDFQIDASTCLFPDSTWFIKDLEHNPFPNCVNELISSICRSDKQMTIDDDARFPQYLIYENDSIAPLNSDNSNTTDWVEDRPSAFIRFITALINFLKEKLPEWFKKAQS